MGCQRLTYHQKYTSKTESTPIFEMGGKQCSDYQVFGMQMPGRSHQTDAYRYGFNGMEKDDEVKGESNSLDFGARIYDPRVGRWLSRDKLEGKKPYLTPYQGFKNNPVIFTDPDGNDEYLTTIIKLKDGTTQIIENDKRISQKSMASAAWGTMNLFAVQEFRDIRTTVTYTQGENGAFTKSTTSVAEGEEKFFKEYIFPYDKGTIVDFGPIFGDGKETQPGGFNLTSEDGGVSSTKTISENDAESRDIGALLDALGGLKNGSLGSDDADRIKDLVDMVQDMNELVPIDGSGGEGSDKTAGGGKPIPDANIIIWKYPKDNYYNAGDRPQATPEQMEKGDTVGGNPDKNIYPEK